MFDLPEMDRNELGDSLADGEPTLKEFFTANVKDGFANSTLGVGMNEVLENYKSAPEERASKDQAQENIQAFYEKRKPNVVDASSPQIVPPLSEDDYKNSAHFREGIKFQSGWSEERAKYLAEVYDERQLSNLTMDKGGKGAFRTGVGFAGQMVGGMPDPVNFIPFAGGTSKAAGIGVKLAKGAIEGAVGNLAVSAVTRPYWEDRGVDSSWSDYVNDVTIGGVLGGGFAGAGHVLSRAKEIRKNVPLADRKVMGDAMDGAVSSIINGETFDPSKLERFNESVKSLYDIPEVKRSQKVQELSTQLQDLGFSPDEAKTSIAPMVAHAQAFASDFNMGVDDFLEKYGATFQKAEMKGDAIVGIDTTPQDKRLTELLDSELMNMKEEVFFAEKGGQKIFKDGEYVSTTGEGTFPSWYQEAGIKNKDHLDKVLAAKKGPVFDRVKAIAEQRLLNGYESPASGRVEPANEFRQLKGEEEVYFKKSGKKERGAITLQNEGPSIISLFEGADKSTILHETGHLFLNNLERFSTLADAPAHLKKDFSNIKKWMGVKEGGKIERVHHEKFARGFEQYLREGRAPRADLKIVFDRFKEWLTSIYKSSDQLKANLSNDAREIYGRLLGSEKVPTFEAPSRVEAPEPAFKTEADIDKAVQEAADRGASTEDIAVLRETLEALETADKLTDEVLTFFQSGRTGNILEFANRAGVSEKEFKDFVKEMDDILKKDGIKVDDLLNVAKKFEDTKKQIAAEIAKQKRQALLSGLAKENVAAQAQKILDAGGTPLQAILSQIEGDSVLRGIEGAGNSVHGTYQSLSQAQLSKMHAELKEISPKVEKLFENDTQFNENVITEMMQIREDGKGQVGITNDPDAAKAAAILSKYAEDARQRINLSGGDIGKLDGWIPRTHDAEKMILNEAAWIDFMRENIDQTRTFPGLEGAALDRALYETYQNLITGVRKEMGEIDLSAPSRKSPMGNIAKKLGEQRILHFKDAASELNYTKEFGGGRNILETMTRHVDMMARKTAIMERLGPNPDTILASTIEDLRQKIRNKEIYPDATNEQRQKLIEDLGDKNKIINREGKIGKSLMFMMGEGNSLEAPRMKNFAQFVRALNSVSKLGAATLSQFPDLLNLANEHRLVRDNNLASAWVDTMKYYFSNITPEKQKILDRCGTMADTINMSNFNRFDADNVNNRLGRMNDILFKITGQNWHTRRAKSGFTLALAEDLGEFIEMDFDKLPNGIRDALSQYGSIDKKKWDVIKSVVPENVDGKKYFHPDLVDKVSDDLLDSLLPEEFKLANMPAKDAIQMDVPGLKFEPSDEVKGWQATREKELKRAKFRLENDLRTFFIEETRNAVLEPDLKIKRQMSLGTKSGTYAGEAVRLMTQFKSFAATYYDRSVKGRRFSKTGDMTDYGGVIHHAGASLMLGYISMVAKDLSKGIEPKDPALPQTWMQAGFQSGGLGIMGDFVQAGLARTGADALATMAGPTLTTAAKTLNLGGKISKEIYKDTIGEDGDYFGVISDAVDLGKSQIPFQSLWYTRAAADYLFWYNLKEALEPGSTARSERRLKQEFNQEYIINPSDAIGF